MEEGVRHDTKVDFFEKGIFSPSAWSAPKMTSLEEVRCALARFHLEGRTIKRIKTIGFNYPFGRESIIDGAYCGQSAAAEEELQYVSDYDDISPLVKYERASDIDEPLLIGFADGSQFEIDVYWEGEMCMSMNRIPWDTASLFGPTNVDADILFAPCLRQRIAAVTLNTCEIPREASETGPARNIVSDITLRLENGVGLRIGSCHDFCSVECIGQDDEILKIPFVQLKPGLHNWEDLHNDQTVGYRGESGTFFFGAEAADYADPPYMKLVPGEKDTSLSISIYDFMLFGWSYTDLTGKCFDEYDNYAYSCEQWMRLLSEAEKLLGFASFDELSAYRVSLDIRDRDGSNIPLKQLNRDGPSFWKDRERMRTQLNDMKAWTSLVLGSGDTMRIYGF